MIQLSRRFLLQVRAVPRAAYASGIDQNLISKFCDDINIERREDYAAEKKVYPMLPFEAFNFPNYEVSNGKKVNNSATMKDALLNSWLQACKNSSESMRKSNKKIFASDGIPCDTAKFIIIDLETTTETINHRNANCFDERNHIVLPGWLDYKGYIMIPKQNCTKENFQLLHRNSQNPEDSTTVFHRCLPNLDSYDVLVGHNLKFDLMYLWRDPELVRFLGRGGRIWDTMYAEYLLEGQLGVIPRFLDTNRQEIELEPRKSRRSGVLTLDTIAPKYGGTRKIDLVKKAWENKVPTSEIPNPILAEYLAFDLKNTEKIYFGQLQRAMENSSTHLMHLRMDYILAVCEAEFNGIKVKRCGSVERPIDSEEKNIETMVSKDNVLRPDFAMILTPSAAELVSFGKFMPATEMQRTLFPVDKSAEENQTIAISHFGHEGESAEQGSIYRFSWVNFREACIELLLWTFKLGVGSKGDIPFANVTKVEECYAEFKTMCKHFVCSHSSLGKRESSTKLILEENDKAKHYNLQRVNLCLPFANFIAFEESPFFIRKRFQSKYVSAFNMRSVENDVLNFLVSVIQHVCYGKIFRSVILRKHCINRDFSAVWRSPDLSMGTETVAENEAGQELGVKIIMCSTDALWIDFDNNEKDQISIINQIKKLMSEAISDFCQIFDNFAAALSTDEKPGQSFSKPLKIDVSKLS